MRDWDANPGQRLYGRRIVAQDAFGNVTDQRLGNRATVSAVPGRQLDTYTAQTGQLMSRCVGLESGGCAVLNLSYGYDGWGNLTSQAEAVAAPARPESFLYDELHRLTQATRQGLPAVTYGYDAAGNVRFKSDYSQTSANAYQYATNRPHAVSAVTLALAGNQMAQYEYDGNGNQVARLRNGGVDRAVRYDIHNRPQRIRPSANESEYQQDTVEFRYAPSGERYLQRRFNFSCGGLGNTVCSNSTLTVYPLAGYELTATVPFSSMIELAVWQSTRQQRGGYGVQTTDEVSAALPKRYWLHPDRLGSAVAKTKQDGTIATTTSGYEERHGFDAWGKPRTRSCEDTGPGDMPGVGGVLRSGVTPRGFTSHEHIDGGNHHLIHMNGRAFDPLLGRFLSVDPIIQFPENSQSLNPYSYIMNNPLSGTDPTGYQSCLNPEKQGQCRFTATGSRIVKTGEISSDGKGGVQFSGANSLGGKLYTGVGLVSVSNGAIPGQATSGKIMNQADGSTNGVPQASAIGQFTTSTEKAEISGSFGTSSGSTDEVEQEFLGRYNALHSVLRQRAIDTPKGILDLSGEEFKTLVDWIRHRTVNQPRFSIGSDSFEMQFANYDTFLHGNYLLSGRQFNVGGRVVAEGGHINYIAVGMLAAHYGPNVEQLIPALVVAHNARQIYQGEGLRNLQDIGPGTRWALTGASLYHRLGR